MAEMGGDMTMEQSARAGIGIFGDTGMVGMAIGRLLEGHGLVRTVYRRNSKRTEGSLGGCALCFLATRDADSMRFAREALDAGARVVDMSGAFRLLPPVFERWYGIPHTAPDLAEEAAYGMPAFNAEAIRGARLVANPGCFATAVILSLRPISHLVTGEAVVVATSGNSGARNEVEAESNEVTYTYGRKHKHVPEMNMYSKCDVDFTAVVLRSVYAGINANIRVGLPPSLRDMPPAQAEDELERLIGAAYGGEDLVSVVRDGGGSCGGGGSGNGGGGGSCGGGAPSDRGGLWGTRDAVGTNRLLVKARVDGAHAYICAMLDNLVKGSAGQAIENMNIMLGFPRLTGLAHLTGPAGQA